MCIRDRTYGEVSYAQLKSGTITVNGKDVPTAPLSSVPMAREIAETLKAWMKDKKFFLSKPAQLLPDADMTKE